MKLDKKLIRAFNNNQYKIKYLNAGLCKIVYKEFNINHNNQKYFLTLVGKTKYNDLTKKIPSITFYIISYETINRITGIIYNNLNEIFNIDLDFSDELINKALLNENEFNKAKNKRNIFFNF